MLLNPGCDFSTTAQLRVELKLWLGSVTAGPLSHDKEKSIRQITTSSKKPNPKKKDLQPGAGTLKAGCLLLCVKLLLLLLRAGSS